MSAPNASGGCSRAKRSTDPVAAPILTTDRLLLRGHRAEDFQAMRRLDTDPVAVRTIFHQPLSAEESWARLLRFAGHWTLLGYGLLLVEDRATGKVIGQVGAADFHRGLGADFDGAPEYGWIFAQEVHGRGYATEAMRAAIGWMEAKRGRERTVCIIDPANGPSLRVAAKLGFAAYGEGLYKGKTVVKLERGAAA